jgi:hypothetical protein
MHSSTHFQLAISDLLQRQDKVCVSLLVQKDRFSEGDQKLIDEVLDSLTIRKP